MGQQCAGLAAQHLLAGADDVVPEALAFAEVVGLGKVAVLVEQRHPAVAAQHAFDGGTPGFVGHLDHFGHELVADALGREAAAELLHLRGLRRQLLAFQRLEGLAGELAALL